MGRNELCLLPHIGRFEELFWRAERWGLLAPTFHLVQWPQRPEPGASGRPWRPGSLTIGPVCTVRTTETMWRLHVLPGRELIDAILEHMEPATIDFEVLPWDPGFSLLVARPQSAARPRWLAILDTDSVPYFDRTEF